MPNFFPYFLKNGYYSFLLLILLFWCDVCDLVRHYNLYERGRQNKFKLQPIPF